jgi:hypothetical protein
VKGVSIEHSSALPFVAAVMTHSLMATPLLRMGAKATSLRGDSISFQVISPLGGRGWPQG